MSWFPSVDARLRCERVGGCGTPPTYITQAHDCAHTHTHTHTHFAAATTNCCTATSTSISATSRRELVYWPRRGRWPRRRRARPARYGCAHAQRQSRQKQSGGWGGALDPKGLSRPSEAGAATKYAPSVCVRRPPITSSRLEEAVPTKHTLPRVTPPSTRPIARTVQT